MGKPKYSYCTLDQLGSVSRGKSKHRPRNDPALYGGRYPFIQTGDVKHSQFYITEYTQTYNELGLSQSKLWPANTLCITIAANIADSAILTFPACFPDSIIGFIPDQDKSDLRFVKYCLDTYKKEMQVISKGTTQDNLSQDKLLTIKLLVPPLSTQTKIASILSAYDDLIENNKRRIAILEKMAEEIYREWFVRMRFSSYTNASEDKPVNSNDSNFWSPGQRVPINRLVKFLSGYSFKSQDYSPSGRFGIVTIKNVHDGLYIPDCSDRIEEPPSNMKKYCHLRDGDILMSLTGNVGRVCRVHGTGNLLNQRVAKLAPAIEGTEDFVYWFFRNSSVQTLCELISTGAAQQNLSPIKLGDQLAPLPSIDQIKHFCAVVKSTTEHISNLLKQNQNLTLSRDLLIPRLISGKLSVENLELPTNEKLTAVSSALPEQELAHA